MREDRRVGETVAQRRLHALGFVVAGAWWLDPTVGLLIAAVAVKEGREAWRGEGCCVADPLAGFGQDRCEDDCCA